MLQVSMIFHSFTSVRRHIFQIHFKYHITEGGLFWEFDQDYDIHV